MSSPAERLQRRIAAEGPIPFAEFMAEALYGEGGYYHREPVPIGAQGDYVTGSSLSPLFAAATARLVRRLDVVLDRPADILEVGYGSGRHLENLSRALESGPPRRILALDRVGRPLDNGIERVTDLGALPVRDVQGLVFSYELFDALPVHRLIGAGDGRLEELWVDLDRERNFCYLQRELSGPVLDARLPREILELEQGQIADVTPEWGRLYVQLADLLGQGLIVTCDYGYRRERLFDPRVRFHGTLACYRRQRVHRDALREVGCQDLTAHVDFTTLQRAGEVAGLETVTWTRQARWLLACGIFENLERADPETRLQAIDLLSGSGMGEEIRILVQARSVEASTILDLELLGS